MKQSCRLGVVMRVVVMLAFSVLWSSLSPAQQLIPDAAAVDMYAQIEALRLHSDVAPGHAVAAHQQQSSALSSPKHSLVDQSVRSFRMRYGTPLQNPSVNERLVGVQRMLLERGGLSSQGAAAMSAKMNATPVIDSLKRPFSPQAIVTSVAAIAALNMYRNLRNGSGEDRQSPLAFLAEGRFWRGFAVSSIAYALSSAAVMAVMPAGAMALTAIVPTLAGMAASMVGWRIGTSDKSIGETVKAIDWFDLVGRSTGATMGIVLGGQLGCVLGGSLGSVFGPAGAIVGALVVGSAGSRIASFFRGLFNGEVDAKAVIRKGVQHQLHRGPITLEGLLGTPAAAPTSTNPTSADLRYRRLYQAFVEAHRSNRAVEAVAMLDELRQAKLACQEQTNALR